MATASAFEAHSTRLKPGDKAPDFKAIDQNGNALQLSAFADKTVVLYFYPKDNTPSCTAQACSLRDEYLHLSRKNFVVMGVSPDNERSHLKFSKKYDLPFPLIVDPGMEIIRKYDVWGRKMLFGRVYDGVVRTTFIIRKGVITEVIKKVDTTNHAQQILQA